MTQREKFMYTIMGQLEKDKIPIIFKGGLITKIILENNGYQNLSRETVDIDGNWMAKHAPSKEYLEEVLNKSIKKINSDYYISVYREHGENKSAGIVIMNSVTNKKMLSMDIATECPSSLGLLGQKNTA